MQEFEHIQNPRVLPANTWRVNQWLTLALVSALCFTAGLLGNAALLHRATLENARVWKASASEWKSVAHTYKSMYEKATAEARQQQQRQSAPFDLPQMPPTPPTEPNDSGIRIHHPMT